MAKGAKPVVPARQTWVQTEREAHVAWGRMVVKHPSAAAVMHYLVALMDRGAAVAVSHSTLAKIVGVNERTVRRAIDVLAEGNWIQVLQVGQRGTVNIYVVNSQVAWADYRENLKLATFSARVVVDAADQSPNALEPRQLRRVPIIHPPEEALPVGDWPPGSQAQLPGMEAVVVGPADDDQGDQLDLDDASRATSWIESLPFKERIALHARTKSPAGDMYPPTSMAWKVAAWIDAGRPRTERDNGR